MHLALVSAASADSCVQVPGKDGVPAPVLVDGQDAFPLEPAFEDYAFMLFDACDAWGLSVDQGCDIFPMMGDINENALATICDGNKVIVYDRQLSSKLGYEGAQAVMSHELGHLLCNHLATTTETTAESHNEEFEADRFAGATMRLMGFTREATLSYLPLLTKQPSLSHPGSDERAAELLEGWDVPGSGLRCLIR
jgi:Zn-dependent protease with chaperone function